MYCSSCGNEIKENERYCNNCGQYNKLYVENNAIEQQPHNNTQLENINQQNLNQITNQESATIGILAIVFGAMGGWLGLIFALVGLSTYKTPEHRTKCKIGLGLFIGWIVFLIIISFAL